MATVSIGSEIERQIEKQLSAAGYKVIRQPSRAGRESGVRPDFLVQSPEGKKILIEIKAVKTPVDSMDVLRAAVLRDRLKADEVCLIASSYATPSAKTSASKEFVRVISLAENGGLEGVIGMLAK